MTRTATAGDTLVIKCASDESCGGMAVGAIQCRWYVIRVFTACRYTIMAGGAVVHDAGVIEHRSNKCTGSMANAAILIGRHMRG